MQKKLKFVSLFLLLITAVVLIPLNLKLLGWILLILTAGCLLFCEKHFRRDMLLVVTALVLLGITSINTHINALHVIEMSTTLLLAIALPYVITRRWYKEKTIRFPFHHGRNWYKSEILYILSTVIIAYFLLPFYMQNTGAYHNWTVKLTPSYLVTLFFGTNGLGIWDELFFVNTVLTLFKKHFPFRIANASQAVIFTSFLFELGFRGWAPFFLYPFALLQGYIFKKTDSLLYIITIHLSLDFILYLVLIHSHYPTILSFFIT